MTKSIDGAFYAGFACVYVIAPCEWGPTKVGMATNLARRFWGLQASNWHRLHIFDVHWFPGPPVAARVERHALDALSAVNIRGEWFNELPEVCGQTIRSSAAALGLEWFSEAERRRRTRWKAPASFDALFATGLELPNSGRSDIRAS